MANEKFIVQIASPERYYSRYYHDFIDCPLLTGEEKIMYLALKRFLNVREDNGNVFPTIEKLQTITSWGKQKVIDNIKSLVKKGVVKKIRQGLSKPNIYVIADYPTMWTCDNIEDMATIIDNGGVKPLTPAEHIAGLERMGYKIEIKEKGLVSDSSQTADTSTHLINDNINENNTIITKSQAERYTMKDIRTLYDYSSLVVQYPNKQTDIDIVFDILYDTLNSTKKTIRIGGEDKPAMVVIGKLMKLDFTDIAYSIEKYNEQTERINNPKSYLLTILYNAKEQHHLDIMNLGHHFGDF